MRPYLFVYFRDRAERCTPSKEMYAEQGDVHLTGRKLNQAPALGPHPTLDPTPPLSPNQHSLQQGYFNNNNSIKVTRLPCILKITHWQLRLELPIQIQHTTIAKTLYNNQNSTITKTLYNIKQESIRLEPIIIGYMYHNRNNHSS